MLGSMELIFLPKRKGREKIYKIQMTPLQAYVALSFRSFDQKMTGMQLNSLLNIDGEQGVTPTIDNAKKLKRILHAFCYQPKKKIMLCLDQLSLKKLKKLKIEKAIFQFDINFKTDKNKFKMPKPIFNAKRVVDKTKEDRKDMIDACIVRIMKAATCMKQSLLITDVMVSCC